MNTFKSIFPFNQELIAEYPLMDQAAIEKLLATSAGAFPIWSGRRFEARGAVLSRVALFLRRDLEKLANLITREMGKPLAEARAEIEKCAWVCSYYAETAAAFLEDEIIAADYQACFVHYQPLGAVLAIMPWNFPFWQVFRFAAPTLMAGNVALLKHAPNVTGCSLAIERLFEEASPVEGLFQSLIIDEAAVEQVIAADIVQAVTLTGSERAGRSVAGLAGKYLRKSVMELGGSDALIVLEDADIKRAATVALQSRMQNAGQSCIAAKRFIVVKKVLDDFVGTLHDQISTLKQGNPFEEGIKMGPMARPDLAAQVMNQLQQSLRAGARLDTGGKLNGCNFQPTLLLDVRKGMACFDEEVFGPVAAVIEAADEADALALANASRYGLGASIWTTDIEKGIALSKKIASGSVFINALVKSDPRLPFGGIKNSGYGRELGRHGILEFMNVKTVAAAVPF
jgi:succinate-semialdehyde dehydrogenase / glutarate-semialdehyde dehydrogenase